MKRTLQLTSPNMYGTDVAYARRLLHPAYLAVNPPANASRFDSAAAEASRRAKWMLGYAEKNCTPTFGTDLEKLLTGASDLSLLQRKRAAERAAHGLVARRAVDEALRWVGKTESPAGTNICKPFTTWYGWNGWGAPWCAVFVSYCLDKAGFAPVEPGKARWAYCPYLLRDARDGKFGLSMASEREAAKGTIVLYDWDKDGVPDHVGFATSPVDLRTGTIATVEGNTSPGVEGSQSNGGGVYQRQRSLRDIIAFVSVAA